MAPTSLPGVPAWKVRALYLLATYTPLRSLAVRRQAFRAARTVQRARRRRLERAGDPSRSRPALFGMDVRLAELLGRDGVFVEAGGNDGYTQSNTYYLEAFHGWTGVLVEPMPDLAAEARRNRTARVVQAALTDVEHSGGTLRMYAGGLVSIVAGSKGSEADDRAYVEGAYVRGGVDAHPIEVPARTLSDVLDEAGVGSVDLLSLDLEGYEATALRGLDLERHAPRWILVEAHEQEDADEIRALLGGRYAYVERFSEMDDLYRRADVPAPA